MVARCGRMIQRKTDLIAHNVVYSQPDRLFISGSALGITIVLSAKYCSDKRITEAAVSPRPGALITLLSKHQ